ncbi:protein of unknown function DUF894 DitE [Pseudobacteroides cellulosolvens ATCC 35603 = DSM 2933]|uniref:Major facilitator superfamily (MFS) profile domain-containing protein n=1 Tax=Pseudobacteroides cellulosolvens ATCC 35603 = DSM 2933 TaxID=398512 RepID=A0A0L6JLN0_9FIRM|nr:protein of unknown function DUF894 DitE [Pseudobacteroides cellulosolvens ATCC 35603 = DSM 2933]
MKELFGNRVFRIIMTTDIIQQLCIWIRNISVLFFIIEKTDADPVAVSLITVFEYLPMFVFSYIGGTLADKWNPKRTMIIGDFLSSVSVFLILLFISQGLWQMVFAATLMSSLVSQFSIPSSNIMFKRHVDEKLINSAISLSQCWQSIFLIVGPVFGTLLYGKAGITASLVVIAVMFFISSMVQLLLPDSKKEVSILKTSVFKDMKEGIRYVKYNSGLKVISILYILLGFAQGLTQPLAVYIVTERLGIAKEYLQWLYSIFGVGLLIGAIMAALFVNRFKIKLILFLGMIVFSFTTTLEALSTIVSITSITYFFAGAVLAFLQVALSSPLIKSVSEEFIGRISGLVTPLLTGGILIGSSLSGVLAKQISIIPLFLISSILMIICAFVSLLYKDK